MVFFQVKAELMQACPVKGCVGASGGFEIILSMLKELDKDILKSISSGTFLQKKSLF